MSDVTANAASSDTTTEIMAAMKNRPAYGGHESRNVYLVQADQEEEDEDPDTQEEREFVHRMDYSGDGPQ